MLLSSLLYSPWVSQPFCDVVLRSFRPTRFHHIEPLHHSLWDGPPLALPMLFHRLRMLSDNSLHPVFPVWAISVFP